MPPKHNSRIEYLGSVEEFIHRIGLPSLNTLETVENGHLFMTVPFDGFIDGNKMFNYVKSINALFPKYSYLSKAGEQKATNHYSFKSFFMNIADAGIKTDEGTSIMFKVVLNGKDKIGGSVSLHDLGLFDREDIQLFLSLFDGGLTSATDRQKNIYDVMKNYFMGELIHCMAREIIEECTPTGKMAYALSDILNGLSFVDTPGGTSGKIHFHFQYSGEIPFEKQRELDIFPIIWDGSIKNCYYTYSSRERKGYSLIAPFKHNPKNIYMPEKFTEKYVRIQRTITRENLNEIYNLLEKPNNLEIGVNTSYNKQVKNLKDMKNTQNIIREIDQIIEEDARMKLLQTLFSKKAPITSVVSTKNTHKKLSISELFGKPIQAPIESTPRAPLINILKQPVVKSPNIRQPIEHPKDHLLLQLLRKKPTG